jgi:predicted RNase H-like HicB family nuclease
MELSLTIRYQQDEEGWWVAEIPEIPGAFSQGRTPEEARAMVLDAARELTEARRARAIKDSPASRTETLDLAG